MWPPGFWKVARISGRAREFHWFFETAATRSIERARVRIHLQLKSKVAVFELEIQEGGHGQTILVAVSPYASLSYRQQSGRAQNRSRPRPAGSAATVYELRVYHANEGKLDDLLKRFREHTTRLFEKHGMKNVAYWTPLDDPLAGQNAHLYSRPPQPGGRDQ